MTPRIPLKSLKLDARSRRALLALILTGFVALVLTAGCLSPTLPLPPPSRPLMSAPDADGNIHIQGIVSSRASVFVLNTRTDDIVGKQTGETGRYELTIAAEIGDELYLWESSETRESETLLLVVPAEDDGDDVPPPPTGMGGTAQ